MVLEDIVKYLLISTRMGFCFGEIIQLENHYLPPSVILVLGRVTDYKKKIMRKHTVVARDGHTRG